MRGDGLTLDATGRTLHPSSAARRLRAVSYCCGDERDAQVFASLLTVRIDLEERVNFSRWLRAHLGRYLRFSPSDVDAMGRREAMRYLPILNDILRAEAGKVPNESDR